MEEIDTCTSLLVPTLRAFKGRKGAIQNKMKLLYRPASSRVCQMMTDLEWMLKQLNEKAAEVVRSRQAFLQKRKVDQPAESSCQKKCKDAVSISKQETSFVSIM